MPCGSARVRPVAARCACPKALLFWKRVVTNKLTPSAGRRIAARELQSLVDFRLLGGVCGRNGNTHTPPERCPTGYQRRAVPPLAHYRPLSRGEGPPCLQGCRHHIYAPLQKSVSLGLRASSYLRRRWWRTFKVNPSGMPRSYVAETPDMLRGHRSATGPVHGLVVSNC